MSKLTNNDKKYLKVIAFVVFIINTLIILFLPTLVINTNRNIGTSLRGTNPELFVTSIGLALVSINMLCCGVIFSLKMDPNEKNEQDGINLS